MEKKVRKRITITDFKRDKFGKLILKNGKPLLGRFRVKTKNEVQK